MMKLINATEPNFGVVEDHMIMDSEPVLGKWSIAANAHSLVGAAEFINLYWTFIKKLSYDLGTHRLTHP